MRPLHCSVPPGPETVAECTMLWARPGPTVAPVRRDRSTCVFERTPPPVAAGMCGPIVDGRYRLVASLKRGGMGVLYAAEHLLTGRRVAVKLLREPWCHDSVARERLRREAQASARIGHPNIVDTLDFGITPEGHCYLVMELLYGEDLHATLRRERRLPLPRAADIMQQICAALAAAHAAGIVHRDIKPANCFRVGFCGASDHIKLIDFGLARSTRATDVGDDPLTAVGTILGTSLYMSPEQASGGPVDHRVDIYASGVLLYQMITGQPPFRARTAAETFRRILAEEPPSARGACPELSPAFDELIHTALAKRPEARFASMAAFAEALAGLPDLRPGARQASARVAGPRPWSGTWRAAALPMTALLAAMFASR